MVLSSFSRMFFVLAGLALGLQVDGAQAQEVKEILGAAEAAPMEFKPQKMEPELSDEVKSLAFADWGKIHTLGDGARRITKLRIYRFRLNEDDEGIDLTIKDAESLAVWDSFFNLGGGFTRPAIGDLENTDFGALSGGYGILVFERKSGEKFQLGVSRDGFYLGRWHGTARTRLYCYGLAVHLNETLKKRADRKIPTPLLQALTGEAVLLRAKDRYEKLVRAAKAD